MPGSGASNRSWPPQPADLPFVPGQPTHAPRPRIPAAAWVTVQPPRPPAQDATPAKGNLGVARTSTCQAHSTPVSIDESPGKRRPRIRSYELNCDRAGGAGPSMSDRASTSAPESGHLAGNGSCTSTANGDRRRVCSRPGPRRPNGASVRSRSRCCRAALDLAGLCR